MFVNMSGRKRLYTPENLKIGEKEQLTGRAADFPDQYLYQFRQRTKNKLRILKQGKKVFVERIA